MTFDGKNLHPSLTQKLKYVNTNLPRSTRKFCFTNVNYLKNKRQRIFANSSKIYMLSPLNKRFIIIICMFSVSLYCNKSSGSYLKRYCFSTEQKPEIYLRNDNTPFQQHFCKKSDFIGTVFNHFLRSSIFNVFTRRIDLGQDVLMNIR